MQAVFYGYNYKIVKSYILVEEHPGLFLQYLRRIFFSRN